MQDTDSLFESMLNPSKASQVPAAPTDLKGMTIAYSTKSPVGTTVSPDAVQAVQNAVSFLKSQGFNMVQVDSPVDGVKLMQTYYMAATSSGSNANYIINTKTKANMTFDQVSPMTWALYQASKKLPADFRTNYTNELSLIDQQMTAFHQKYPLYLTPTTATTAPRNDDPAFLPEYVNQLENIGSLDSPQQLQLIYDAWLHGLAKTPFTQLANFAGEPAISLPTYVSPAGMPLGIQLEAGKNQDRLLLKMGDLFESHGLFKELSHQSPNPAPSPTPIPSDNSAVVSSSSSSTSASSVSTPTLPTNDQNYAKEQSFVAYAVKKVYLYKSANFSKNGRIAVYNKVPRPKRPMFLVTGYTKDNNGKLRYKVRDINRHSKNYNKQGYLTTNDHFVQNSYYQSTPTRIKVINPKGINEYRTVSLSKKIKHAKKGTTLRVKKIITHNLTTRFLLQNGNVISANKKLVIAER